VKAMGTDFLACSPYKFFAPHLGLLYGRRDLLESLAPYKVRPATDASPGKWETGTQSGESLAGLLGTFQYMEWLGREFGGAAIGATRREALVAAMGAIHATERGLSLRALAALGSVPGLELRGITDPARIEERVPTYAFTLRGHSPSEVSAALGKRGIATWDGDYYAYELIRALGLAESGGMVRVGFVHYNDPAEIDRLAEELTTIARS
jgi:selenocysteine lyase/cysteine desulfurase